MKTTDLVKNWLYSEGYKYEIDDDGDLKFKFNGHSMWCIPDPNDPLYLRIALVIGFEDYNKDKMLDAANTVNKDIKAIKTFIANDSVWFSIEMYIDSSPELEDFLERCLNILLAGRQKFIEMINDK
jgi:hypothetical protein